MHDEKHYSIQWMCKAAGVDRASYYKWLHRPIPAKEQEDQKIAGKIRKINEEYHGLYGYRRMTAKLNKDGRKNYKVKRIHRIMEIIDVHSSIRRVRHCCTVSNRKDQTADNLLNRNFEASRPNEKWTTDVSEFKVPGSSKKIYLSAFMDLYDRSIVSCKVSDRNDNKLVFDTFEEAIRVYPDATPLFHSDRGYQYTSPVFHKLLTDQGMTQSMSRVHCCIDNGPQEAFWGIVKTEMPCLFEYHDRESLIEAIGKYIEFYNTRRFQVRFDNKTPMEVRQEGLKAETPKLYPIPVNHKIEKYFEGLKSHKNPAESSSAGSAIL